MKPLYWLGITLCALAVVIAYTFTHFGIKGAMPISASVATIGVLLIVMACIKQIVKSTKGQRNESGS